MNYVLELWFVDSLSYDDDDGDSIGGWLLWQIILTIGKNYLLNLEEIRKEELYLKISRKLDNRKPMNKHFELFIDN